MTGGVSTNVSSTARQTGTSTACAQYSTAMTRMQPANVIQLPSDLNASAITDRLGSKACAHELTQQDERRASARN